MKTTYPGHAKSMSFNMIMTTIFCILTAWNGGAENTQEHILPARDGFIENKTLGNKQSSQPHLPVLDIFLLLISGHVIRPYNAKIILSQKSNISCSFPYSLKSLHNTVIQFPHNNVYTGQFLFSPGVLVLTGHPETIPATSTSSVG